MKAHLVGSVGLRTVDDVFATVGRMLGTYLERIPDGEPGGRRVWVNWQYPVFLGNPFLKLGEESDRASRGARLLRLKLADGVSPHDVIFSELGYSREARSSYSDFESARQKGFFPSSTRFQVCLPTPINVAGTACTPAALLDIEPAYERAMLEEITRLCEAIPHNELCIQFDMVREVYWWDGRPLATQPTPFPEADLKEQVLSRLSRLCGAVPRYVQLGFHFCYGDWGGKHQIEPLDTSAMVQLANAIVQRAGRDITYIHFPVPIARKDAEYFEPLRDLKLSSSTEVYLGLIHLADGVSGARDRMETAKQFLPEFGCATECGLGRAKTPNVVLDILKLHAELCSAK
jgi:hypothetical protein